MSINFTIKADWKPTLKWLKNIQRGTDDARPLWVAMIPRVKEFVAAEFSGANTSKWPALTPKYRQWKTKMGYPAWIGTMTGAMGKAAGPGAIISVQPKKMTWKLNSAAALSDKGYPYSGVFHFGRRDGSQPARTIYKSTVLRVNQFLQTDIRDLEGGGKASFTFKWLERALDPYRV